MKQSRPLSYRPDIDGMRAIAVLSVVLFHIGKSLVPGGFAGVDVFFVISGYLITQLIYSEMLRGEFSLSDFYKRRINRIAPALFGLVAGVSIIGLFVLSPADLLRLLKGGLFAGVGLSNVFFWREYGSYFSSGIDEAPLLHTWSLGVEEQFYVFWPLALWAIVRLKPAYKYFSIGAAIFAGILVSELGVRTAATASYYLLPTRAYELLIGGALAIFFFHRPKAMELRAANSFGAIGALLLFGSFYFLNSKVTFPGVNAAYPCLGAVLLIAAGSNKDALLTRLLASKPLVFIGLISYSLYLWHWPLIAFVHYLGIDITITVGSCIFALSVLLGWASWKYVEKPFRGTGNILSFGRIATRRYLAPISVMLLAYVGIVQSGGLPNRFDPRVPKYEKIILTAPNELRANCHSPTFYYDRKPSSSCLLGVPARAPEILMIGDSYANHFTGMVDILAKNDNVTVTDYTMDGCMPIKGKGYGSQESYAKKCKVRNDFNYEFIASSKFKYVILGGAWPVDGTEQEFADLQTGLKESIATIIAAGAKPIIIIGNEGTENANCPVRRLLTGSAASCDKQQEAHQMRDEMFAALKAAYPQVSYVDPNLAICSQGVCHAMLGDVPLYRDSSHLNDVGSREIGKVLVEKHVHLVDAAGLVAQHQP